jgi:hypothetical protein
VPRLTTTQDDVSLGEHALLLALQTLQLAGQQCRRLTTHVSDLVDQVALVATDLVELSELRRLLIRLRLGYRHRPLFVLGWSIWRRRHHAIPRACHIRGQLIRQALVSQ